MIIQLIPLFRIIQNSSQVDYSEFQIIPGLASLCPHSVRPSVTVFYYMKKWRCMYISFLDLMSVQIWHVFTMSSNRLIFYVVPVVTFNVVVFHLYAPASSCSFAASFKENPLICIIQNPSVIQARNENLKALNHSFCFACQQMQFSIPPRHYMY